MNIVITRRKKRSIILFIINALERVVCRSGIGYLIKPSNQNLLCIFHLRDIDRRRVIRDSTGPSMPIGCILVNAMRDVLI